MPSWPNPTYPALWFPPKLGMLSMRIVSLVGLIVSPVIVNRDTRLTGTCDVPKGQAANLLNV